MKIKLILFLTILVLYKLPAQNDSTSSLKNGIGLSLSPKLSMEINTNNQSQYACFSAAAGISGIFVISKKRKLFLNAELGYTNNGKLQKNIPNFVVVIPGSGSQHSYGPTSYFSFYDRFNYIYLAISIQKAFLQLGKKVFLFGGIGAQLNYNYSIFEKTKGHLDYNGNNIDITYRASGLSISQFFSVSAFAKVGISAKLTNHLSCFASPVFYYGLNPKILFRKNFSDFNNLGINLQLIYNF